MNDREKQIEEMVKITSMQCGECNTCKFSDMRRFGGCTDYLIANELYEQGYRKLPEGARVFIPDGQIVLLTREEYEELQVEKDFDYGYHEGERNMTSYYENIRLPDVRKETAREILDMFNDRNIITWDDLVQAIAKRYGVEIEEG